MDVIIIGAGISGISAAVQLQKNGYKVMILQANNYIGGRVKSVPVQLFSGQTFMFDKGASWIHDWNKHHPIGKLAQQCDLKLCQSFYQKIEYYDEFGQKIKNKIVDKQYADYENILKKIKKDNKKAGFKQQLLRIAPQKINNNIFMFNASHDIQFETSSTCLDMLVGQSLNDFGQQGLEKIVCNGYTKILDYLIHKYNLKILLNQQVIKIKKNQYQNQIYSQIFCKNGSKFQAQKVIISVPLGVLKSDVIKFEPHLPQKKLNSIHKLGYGNICKVLIICEQPLTNIHSPFIGIINNDPQKAGYLSFWVNFNILIKKPILMTFALGRSANFAQKINDQQFKIQIKKKLYCLYKKQISLNKFRVYRSNWLEDHTSFGAYTYPRKDCGFKDYRNLGMPIFQNGWYFCGQHTRYNDKSTVRSAYESGKYNVNTIIRQIKSQSDWRYIDDKQ